MFTKGQTVWYFNANEIKTAKYEKDIPNSSIVEMRDDSQFNWQCYTTKDHVFATEDECRDAFVNRPGIWIITASGEDASAVLVKGTLKQIKTYFENSLHRKYPGSEVQFSEKIINTVVLTHFSAIQTITAKADSEDSITFKACRVEDEPPNLDEMYKCNF